MCLYTYKTEIFTLMGMCLYISKTEIFTLKIREALYVASTELFTPMEVYVYILVKLNCLH